jgi:hypothetical protein
MNMTWIARKGAPEAKMRDVRHAHGINKYCGDGFPARPFS